MVIQHNLSAMNANRQFSIVNNNKAKSTEKLSSGYRINRAADDAAGLAMSEKMRRQVRGLTQASANCQDAVSFSQVADGALSEVHDMIQRINELSVKSANGTLTETDRGYINTEVQQIKSEIGRIFDTTSFNEQLIFVEPYVPEIEVISDEIDFQIFNGENGKMGGVLVNNRRYTWEELGLTTAPNDYMNSDQTAFTKSGTVNVNIEPAPEVLTLKFEKDSPSGDVSRVYSWAADPANGITVNNNTNKPIAWSDLGITGEPVNPGKYSFEYGGTKISFHITEPSSFSEVANRINAGGITWNTKPAFVEAEDAAYLKDFTNNIEFTSSNNNYLLDPKMHLAVTGSSPQSYVQLQSKTMGGYDKTQWSSLTTAGGHKINDWGLQTGEGANIPLGIKNPDTLDDSETYTYTDSNTGFSFSFGLSDEASYDAVVDSINNSTLIRTFNAPMGSTATGTTSWSNSSVTFSSNVYFINSGNMGINVSDTDLSFGLQNILGRTMDTNDSFSTSVGINDNSGSYTLSYKIKGDNATPATYTLDISKNDLLKAIQNGGNRTYTLSLSNGAALLSGVDPDEIAEGIKGISDADKTVKLTLDFSDLKKELNKMQDARLAKYNSDLATNRTSMISAVNTAIPFDIESGSLHTDVNPDSIYKAYKQTWSKIPEADAKAEISRYMQRLGYKNGKDASAQASIDGKWNTLVNDMYIALKNSLTNENHIINNYNEDIPKINDTFVSLAAKAIGIGTPSTLSDVNVQKANVDFALKLANTASYTTKFDFEVDAPEKELDIQSGSESNTQITMRWQPLNKTIIGFSRTNVSTVTDSRSAIMETKKALSVISNTRTKFGAYQNRFEHTIKNLDNVVENTTAAESRIRDTDMSKEMVQMSMLNILSQAGTSMVSQANQSRQNILSLLQ